MPGVLVLVRHGESEFNAEDRFAGRLDVPLTATGRRQARRAGELLARSAVPPDVVFTSPLARALDTARIVIAASGRAGEPEVWDALVERAYGSLEGCSRVKVTERFGAAQVRDWRRGWHIRPPTSSGSPAESLQDVADRVMPFWHSTVEPRLAAGATVVVVGHGNSLRVAVRYLEHLDEAATGARQIPVGVPFRYAFDEGSRIGTPVYLDAEAAAAGVEIELHRGRR